MRLLLVEDDEALRTVTAQRLRREGYAADECGDGIEGMDYAINADYDGLVLDISAMLSTAKVRVLSFSSRGMPDGFAITSIVLEVAGSEQLELLMKKLKGIQGVMDVKRPTG